MTDSGSVGCHCLARHVGTTRKDGSVHVTFYGYHNHECQHQYAVNFVDPLEACYQLGQMVDIKLLAGMTDYLEIRNTIIKENIEVGCVEGRVHDNLERYIHVDGVNTIRRLLHGVCMM